ncbi:YdcF family protein [Clostridium chrysemydis]|uniref:YdcF family protein n=1 Tax=Clostridium chrysemydis TaxID=2665504 RepID=UPI0018837E2A|nr:YdcF family protein [Clostridium chrysemydis]
MNWLVIGVTLFTLGIFLISFYTDKRRMINGFLFNIFLLTLFLAIMYAAFTTGNPILMMFVGIILIILVITFIFAIYVLIIGLLINTKTVIKKEGKSLPNLLTLFLAVALIGVVIWSYISPERFLPPTWATLLGTVNLIWLYYCIDVFNFLMIEFLYQFNKPKLNQDFVIVLGCGLNKDKVTPLLASRVDKGIEFYRKQSSLNNSPKLIFSGGKGTDESISEALGMFNYAISKGVKEEDCILEDKSVNTLQNMKFSKDIMDKIKGTNNYNSIFVTSNFHIFRAGIYARWAGLKSQGIGSKTARFYLPNALIREYIAIVVMYKKRHIIVVSAIMIFGILLALLQHFIA